MKLKFLIVTGLCFLLAIGYSCKNEKESCCVESDSAKACKDTVLKKMVIIANVTVKADKADAFIEAAKEMIENSNKEPGCKFYQLYQNPYDKTKLVFVEEYTDSNAVNAHFGAEYFKAFGPKISDMLANPAEIKIITVDDVKIK